MSHTHKIGSAAAELMAYNTYNELGELTAKKVGNTDTAPLQSVSYRYNIRGWLTGINSTFDLGLETGPQDLFAFNINYNHSISNSMGGSVKSLYNGNIAETSWRTASDNIERRYGYSYDNLNRLAEAYYQIPYAAVPLRNSYNESLTYDKNGNIMSLNRNGGLDSATTVVEIDELTYTYDGTKKNQLIKVTDGSNSTQGFNNGTSSTNTDYTYDDFGNLKTDLNKGITGIKYNHLNLPVEVKFDNSDTKKINYIYNAAGVKLKKTVTDGATVTTTDYLNGFQYVGSVLEFFPTAEGYVKNTVVGSTNNYNYVYHYKDHLGNVRISYTVDPADSVLKILEENHYYPFGLKHESYSATQQMIRGVSGGGITIVPVTGPNDLTYKYNYQEQERQDEFGLNWDSFKWRNYDYAIGRFMNVDPLAEKYIYNSPYAFQENKMGMGRELEGLELVPHQWTSYIATKIASWTSSTSKARSDLKSSILNRATARVRGEKDTRTINIANNAVNLNQTQDAITMTKSIAVIGKETKKVAKELIRDGADAAENGGDVLIVIAPGTGPAAPIVAGTGGVLSGGGTIVNGAMDIAEGKWEDLGERVVKEAVTGGLGAVVKNAPGVDDETARIVESHITTYEEVVIPEVIERKEESNEKQ